MEVKINNRLTVDVSIDIFQDESAFTHKVLYDYSFAIDNVWIERHGEWFSVGEALTTRMNEALTKDIVEILDEKFRCETGEFL